MNTVLTVFAALPMLAGHVRGGSLAASVTVDEATSIGDGWADIVALVLILIGALLCLTAAIGLLRFRDVPTRLHAATKPQVLGFLLICIAIALSLRSWAVVAFLLPVILIQFATAPLSAHMVGRQAYRNGTIDEADLLVDEFARDRGGRPDTHG